MSNEGDFGKQSTYQDNNEVILAQDNTKKTKKKEMIQKLRIDELDQENNTLESFEQQASHNKCPQHPEEDFQFYCFSKEQLLCSECLVSGKYVGLEIANLRKAAEKLRGKFNNFIVGSFEKFENINSLEEEIKDYEEQMEVGITAYEEEISKLFTTIREKVNAKEQDLLDNLATLRQERANQLNTIAAFLQNYKEEIDGLKSSLEGELKNLDELETCRYYLGKTDIIKDLTSNQGMKSEDIKEIIENQQLQDQMSLCKLQEECRSITSSIDALGGLEIEKVKQSGKELAKPKRMSSFFSNIESDHNNLKESRETLLLRSSTPSRSNLSQKPTYLPEDLSTGNNFSRSPSNNLFEKHMAKVHEIRRQTPKHETRIEANILTTAEIKRPESRNSMILDMKRNSVNKKFAGLSLNDSSSILDSYKDILHKKTESKTPKTFMLSTNLTPSNKSLGCDIYSPSNLKTTSLMTSITSLTSKASDRPEKIGFDSTMRYMKLDKNLQELQKPAINRKNSTKSAMRESESALGLNVDKMFARRNVPEKRPEAASFGDRGMKKKLDSLSVSLFK